MSTHDVRKPPVVRGKQVPSEGTPKGALVSRGWRSPPLVHQTQHQITTISPYKALPFSLAEVCNDIPVCYTLLLSSFGAHHTGLGLLGLAIAKSACEEQPHRYHSHHFEDCCPSACPWTCINLKQAHEQHNTNFHIAKPIDSSCWQ